MDLRALLEDDPSAWLGDSKIGAREVEVSDPHDLAAPHRLRLELTDGAVAVVHRG